MDEKPDQIKVDINDDEQREIMKGFFDYLKEVREAEIRSGIFQPTAEQVQAKESFLEEENKKLREELERLKKLNPSPA